MTLSLAVPTDGAALSRSSYESPPPVRLQDIDFITRGIAPVIREYVERTVRPLRDELEIRQHQHEAAIAQMDALFAEVRAENLELRATLREMAEMELRSVREAVAEIQNGKDGDPGLPGRDADEDAIVARVRALIPDPEPGAPGCDGKDADPDLMRQMIVDEVARTLPAPVPGPPGASGVPGDPMLLLPDLERMVTDAFASLPDPAPGPQGEPGPAGANADPAVLLPDIERMVASAVERGIALIEPVPGPPGPQGEQGSPGESITADDVVPLVLAALPPPEPGKDGRSLAAIKRLGDQIVLTMNDGELMSFDDIRGMPGPEGPQGAPGKDGASVDPNTVKAMVIDAVAHAVGALPSPPAGEKGDKGDPGQDVDLDAVAVMIEDSVRRTLADWPRPEDGKDAEVDWDRILRQIESTAEELVYREVLKLPQPQDGAPGRDGKDAEVDYQRLQDAIEATVHREVEQEVVKQLLELPEPEPGPKGDKGDPGEKGQDADPELVRQLVADAVAQIEPVPGPQGEPGRDGQHAEVDYELICRELRGDLSQMVAELPPPAKGDPGDPGRDGTDADMDLLARWIDERFAALPVPKDGQDGVPGKDAEVDYEHIQEIIAAHTMREVAEQLVRAIAALPPPERGPEGPQGPRGERGEPGRDGKDGADIAGGFKAHDGRAILTLTNGTVIDFGVIQGRDGKDGAPGKDGLSFGDFMLDADYDGERCIRLRFSDAKGNLVIKEWRIPIPIYRGIWRSDAQYEIGDAVSRGGSVFIAKENTNQPPAEDNGCWVMSTKRGRDGRDGAQGERGEKGERGPAGRDLTDLGRK
jgi:integrin beta 3